MTQKTCSDPDVLWIYRTNVGHNCWCFQYPAIEAAYVQVNIHMKFFFKTEYGYWKSYMCRGMENFWLQMSAIMISVVTLTGCWKERVRGSDTAYRLWHLSCKPAILRGSVLHDPNINTSVQEFSFSWLNAICQSPPPSPEHIHFSKITSASNYTSYWVNPLFYFKWLFKQLIKPTRSFL